jgi:hypothetical protein
MFAEEGGCGGVETCQIHRPRKGIDVACEERRADLMAGGFDGEDAILVGFGGRGVAGVERLGDDLRSEDTDGSGQGAVEGANEVGGRDARLKSKTGDLRESVHAGVGAAGALGQRRFTDDAAEGGLQLALDGGFAGLDLPSVEIGAVVGEGEFPRLILLQRGLGQVCHGNQFRKQGKYQSN